MESRIELFVPHCQHLFKSLLPLLHFHLLHPALLNVQDLAFFLICWTRQKRDENQVSRPSPSFPSGRSVPYETENLAKIKIFPSQPLHLQP